MHILILCNGEPPSPELLSRYHSRTDYLIAADGGGDVALAMGYKPDVVIGDLDSFKKDQQTSFEIIHKTDQETNDLEKALELALRKQGTDVSILGATGRRLDQTLKNLSVLKQFDKSFDEISLIDNYGKIQLLPNRFRQEIPVGTTLSLFPLSGRVNGITTSGLQYSLSNEALENGVRDGSSNKVVSNPVRIIHTSGDLLLFTAHQTEAELP